MSENVTQPSTDTGVSPATQWAIDNDFFGTPEEIQAAYAKAQSSGETESKGTTAPVLVFLPDEGDTLLIEEWTFKRGKGGKARLARKVRAEILENVGPAAAMNREYLGRVRVYRLDSVELDYSAKE